MLTKVFLEYHYILYAMGNHIDTLQSEIVAFFKLW